MSAVLEEYKALLERLHALIQRGADEGQEGEDIRDGMDPLWYRMTDAEREEVGRYSEELYKGGGC